MGDKEKPLHGNRVRVALPARVRGMTEEHRFFDEQTKTIILGENEAVLRIHALPELDTEIHVTALETDVAGIYRVIWLGTQPPEGGYELGLEKIESDGDPWNLTFPKNDGSAGASVTEYTLQCRRCHQQMLSAVPEAEDEFIRPGFRVARSCDKCKATTEWDFALPDKPSEAEQATTGDKGFLDLRGKGRAPIKVRMKVIRKKFGSPLEDICHSENISRTGALFMTSQVYEIGESISVILPYKEGDVAIPVAARVVRMVPNPSGLYHGVAIELFPRQNR